MTKIAAAVPKKTGQLAVIARIAVGPNAVGEAAGFDFATTYANGVPSAIAVELHLFSAFAKADKP